jgi:hypothetical protein
MIYILSGMITGSRSCHQSQQTYKIVYELLEQISEETKNKRTKSSEIKLSKRKILMISKLDDVNVK